MSSSGGLGYGLNQRNNKKRKKRGGGGLTGFADSDDSSSDDNNSNTAGQQLSGRSAINREIAAEQSALRKRAEAAMASSNMDSAMYDYDGEYDSFASAGKKESSSTKTQQQKEAAAEKGQSRYISNLLKSSQRRAQEQEIIYERKVAKQQAEEDANNMEYEGKEKFITSAYKKKLAEREAWAKEEEVRAKREAEDDVTQKKGGNFLFAGFGRNVIMGVNNNKQSSAKNTDEVQPKNDDDIPPIATNGSRKEKEASPQSHLHYSRQSEAVARDRKPQPTGRMQGESTKTSESEAKEKPMTRSQILAERAVKIRDARERYFHRHGLQAQ
jgi:coiled-coil domain-containing protein 55